jgi:hypothetical protein
VDIGTFWDIIETARASAGQDSPFHESLTDHLATLGERDIVEYRECFEKTHGVLYRYDLWAVAYLGGCSDDGFIDFRAGLIAQGRDWYQKAAASPDSLADHVAVARAGHPRRGNPLFYEEVDYAASRAFRRVSGNDHAFWDALEARGPGERLAVMGEEFDFDDDQEMRRRLPRLSTCRPHRPGSSPSLNMIDSAAFDEVKVARTGSARPWDNQITERAANGLMPVRAPAEWSTCFSYPQFRCKEAAETGRTA